MFLTVLIQTHRSHHVTPGHFDAIDVWSYTLDGFVYRGGTLSAIKVAGANTYPRDINNVGQIVGTFEDRNGRHGFLYESGTFTRFDVPGSVETEVYGVNDPGVIVGVSVSIPAIPEPGLLVFVCLGLFGIGLAWKRKSSRIR